MRQGKPHRILQVCSSSATSGAERHVHSLSVLLKERGHYVKVVTPDDGWLTESLIRSGVPVRQSWMKGAGWYRTLGVLLRTVRKEKIDLVHTHLTRAAYIGHYAGIIARVPVVTSVHIANNDAIYKRLARGSNRLVAVSEFVAGMLHGKGVPDRHISTVHHGTDFVHFPHTPREGVLDEFGIPRERRVVGMVGKICRDKGQIELLRAMRDVRKEHPTSHVMFVGRIEEEHRPHLESALDETGMRDRSTFTGIRHDVPRLLDSMTLFTFPTFMETFGLAAIEASARRKAVVATNVGALPEVVRDGQTGLLVDLRPESIAEAVSHLLAEDDLREAMGEQGRAYVEQRFTLDRMAKRFEEVYAAALGQV
ncbi:glycosyltransferase family 4 protein [soil metagenome]